MTRPSLNCPAVFASLMFWLALVPAPAWAVKQFQDQFYAVYLQDTATTPEGAAYSALVRDAKCNLCHIGNSKKDRNTYGIELAKLLDQRKDKRDVAKIRNSLQQVSMLNAEPGASKSKTFGALISERQLPGKTPRVAISTMDTVAGPDETLRDGFSLDAAVTFLDNAALTWHKDRKCFACHSNYTFLETRPVVSWKTPVHDQLRRELEELAAKPRNVGYRVMEGVMAACVLAQNDALTTGKLHPITRQALDYMWTLQSEDGGFDWLKSEQPPSEVDDHFGATMAVLGVGIAPDDYAKTPAAQAGLGEVKKYLKNNPPVNLHQRSMLLLGSVHVEGIMTDSQRKAVVKDLFAIQKPDGGWGIVSLGNWMRHDGRPDDTRSSDGYGTGFTIYVLREAGVPADDARLQAGIAWLKANQRISGRWYTRSQWRDSRHYLSRLGTSYAIRALVECGEQ